jgi:alpha-L-fucosidase
MASYATTSPWNKTNFTNLGALDVLRIRPIPAHSDDVQYTIETQYTHRPDLLAYDLYGTSKLWWVFAQRNMNIIKDPVYDMVAGTTIFLPKKSLLKKALGV